MSKGRSVCVLDEVSQGHRALASAAETTNLGRKREKHGRPVAAGISFGKRAANRATIAHLDIGNSCSAVMENGNFRSRSRCLDLGMPGQRTEAKLAIVFLDVGGAGYEVQIEEMGRVRETRLHQRDQALAARQQLGAFPKLGKHSPCFLQRTCAVIVKRSRIHRAVSLRPVRCSLNKVHTGPISVTKYWSGDYPTIRN